MANYISMANAIKSIFERAKPTAGTHGALAPDGGPEKDMNDQIAVSSYQTKSCEMPDRAQKLYADLPKDTPGSTAEAAAIELDKIFDLFRDARAKGHINPHDLETAATSEKKVRVLAKDMGLEDEHNDILADIMRHLNDYATDAPERFINPEDHVHPSAFEHAQSDASCFVAQYSEGASSQATEEYVDAFGCFPTQNDGGM